MSREPVGPFCYATLTTTPAGQTTPRWLITSRFSDLGMVKWFGRWRRFSFFPTVGSVFDQECLRAIADFCEAKTAQHAVKEDS